jgi:hypothetical protein
VHIREPVVAGQFYPGNREVLKTKIQSFLKAVPNKEGGEIYGIIVPHAGYDYSGQTSAHAFKQIERKQYNTVIILGPSHSYPFNNTAIYPDGYFRTPLGDVGINNEFSLKLVAKSKHIIQDEKPHLNEHSIEVIIPFLQEVITSGTVMSNFKIVPICIGDQSFEVCEELANAIVKTLHEFPDEKALIVASSDFYHGYDYEECKRSVAKSVSLITQYKTEEFHRTFWEENLACGGGCIVACMNVCKEMGAKKSTNVYSTNSGDVTGIKDDYVVGYASFVLI